MDGRRAGPANPRAGDEAQAPSSDKIPDSFASPAFSSDPCRWVPTCGRGNWLLPFRAKCRRLARPLPACRTVQLTRMLLLAALAGLTLARLPPAPSIGAWIYDHPTAWPPAQWEAHVRHFNANLSSSAHRLDHVAVYGSDVELYEQGWCCRPADAEVTGARLAAYGADPSVDVTLVVDGRMDGGQSWSPDLSRLSEQQLESLARWVAQWTCAYERVDGVQLDLEPIAGPWNANLKLFLAALGRHLRSVDWGCVSERRTEGVALSTFALAADVDDELVAALGPEGYVVVSGYDLGPGPAGTPHSPAAYRAALERDLERMLALSARTGCRFMVGIPAAASTKEFEEYAGVPSGYAQAAYVAEALEALKGLESRAPPGVYLGKFLWALTYTNVGARARSARDRSLRARRGGRKRVLTQAPRRLAPFAQVYPPHSDNVMRPTHAFAAKGVRALLQGHSSAAPRPGIPTPPSSPPHHPLPRAHSPPPSPRPPGGGGGGDNLATYLRNGCTDESDCTAILVASGILTAGGGGSYCRTGMDECDRRVCHGDAHSRLHPC